MFSFSVEKDIYLFINSSSEHAIIKSKISDIASEEILFINTKFMSFTKEGYSILFKSVMYYKQTHL